MGRLHFKKMNPKKKTITVGSMEGFWKIVSATKEGRKLKKSFQKKKGRKYFK